MGYQRAGVSRCSKKKSTNSSATGAIPRPYPPHNVASGTGTGGEDRVDGGDAGLDWATASTGDVDGFFEKHSVLPWDEGTASIHGAAKEKNKSFLMVQRDESSSAGEESGGETSGRHAHT